MKLTARLQQRRRQWRAQRVHYICTLKGVDVYANMAPTKIENATVDFPDGFCDVNYGIVSNLRSGNIKLRGTIRAKSAGQVHRASQPARRFLKLYITVVSSLYCLILANCLNASPTLTTVILVLECCLAYPLALALVLPLVFTRRGIIATWHRTMRLRHKGNE